MININDRLNCNENLFIKPKCFYLLPINKNYK